MTVGDKKTLDSVQTPHGKYWVPIVWCMNILKEARREGFVADEFALKTLMEEVQAYRSSLGTLYCYDWISIPLVYTQVTTLAVYSFFMGCVLGRQFLDPGQKYEKHDVDLYVPVFTVLQFFFYMGWLKVAEQMINPFGEDDDDFDMNWIIDRNLQVSYLTVDNFYGVYPILEKDLYFDEHPPDCLPYTKSAMSSVRQPYIGSTFELSVSEKGMEIVTPMETIAEGNPHINPGCEGLSHNVYPNMNSTCESIASSPCPTPRLPERSQGLYNQVLAQNLAGSRLTINSANSLALDKPHFTNVYQQNVPATIPAAHRQPQMEYLETWLHDNNAHLSNTDLAAHLEAVASHEPILSSVEHVQSTPTDHPPAYSTVTGTAPGTPIISTLRRPSLLPTSPLASPSSPLADPSPLTLQLPVATQSQLAAPSTLPGPSPLLTPIRSSTPNDDLDSTCDNLTHNGNPFVNMDAHYTSTPSQSSSNYKRSSIHDTVIDLPDIAEVDTVAIQGSNGSLHEYAVSDSSQSTVNSMAPLLDDYKDNSDIV